MTEGSNGAVSSLLRLADEALLLPVTSLSNPLGATMFMSSFSCPSTDMC